MIGYKYDKKLYVYAYSVQKWLYIEEIFIKLNICIYLIRDEIFFDKYNEIFGKKSAILKKVNREIIYNKTFLTSGKKLIQKDAFIVFIKE